MSLKEDFKKLPAQGKVAIVGGGAIAAYFLIRSMSGLGTAASSSAAAQPVVPSTDTGASGGVSDPTGSYAGVDYTAVANAVNQLGQGQVELTQALATEHDQFMAALNGQTTAISGLNSAIAKQQQAISASAQQLSSQIASKSTPVNVTVEFPASASSANSAPILAQAPVAAPAFHASNASLAAQTSASTIQQVASGQPVPVTPSVALVGTVHDPMASTLITHPEIASSASSIQQVASSQPVTVTPTAALVGTVHDPMASTLIAHPAIALSTSMVRSSASKAAASTAKSKALPRYGSVKAM